MAFPTICINSGTGSDTTASGDNTAVNVNGTAAATHTNTTVNITDAVNLGSVPVDGSACLKVSSSSGRKWSKITAISGSSGNWTVTVGDAYANTESGKSWAIGGKLATLGNNTQLLSDIKGGWTIDPQTGETITADLTLTPTGTSSLLPFIFKSSTWNPSSWGTQPIIQTATSGVPGLNINADNIEVIGISFKCTVGSPVEGNSGIVAKSVHTNKTTITGCIFDGWYNGIDNNNGTYQGMHEVQIVDSEIKNCTHHGIDTAYGPIPISGCYIHDNTQAGIQNGQITDFVQVCTNTVFANNGWAGVVSSSMAVAVNCTFYQNGSTNTQPLGGLNGTSNAVSLVAVNCIFWNNGRSGSVSGGIMGTTFGSASIVNCAFGGTNQTYQYSDGATNAELISQFVPVGTITLTANPFVSSTDYGLNKTAGGGSSCRNAGVFPPNCTANPAPDVGAIPSGGGALALAISPNFGILSGSKM